MKNQATSKNTRTASMKQAAEFNIQASSTVFMISSNIMARAAPHLRVLYQRVLYHALQCEPPLPVASHSLAAQT